MLLQECAERGLAGCSGSAQVDAEIRWGEDGTGHCGVQGEGEPVGGEIEEAEARPEITDHTLWARRFRKTEVCERARQLHVDRRERTILPHSATGMQVDVGTFDHRPAHVA